MKSKSRHNSAKGRTIRPFLIHHTVGAETEESLLDRAMSHHRQGDLAEAEKCYNRILSRNPNHADAYHLLGVIAHQVGNDDQAVAYIIKAIKIDPRVDFYYKNLGDAYHGCRDFESADQCYRKCLESNPNHIDALVNLANNYYVKNMAKEALQYYIKALRLAPDDVTIMNNMGIVFKKLNRQMEAIHIFRKAIEIKPMVETLYNLGNILMSMGHMNDAGHCYQQAIDEDPNCAQAYSGMGCILKECDRCKDAIRYFEKAICLNPGFFDAFYNLGTTYANEQKSEKAIWNFRKALEINPDSEHAVNALLYELKNACYFEQIEDLRHVLNQMTLRALENQEKPAQDPFVCIANSDDVQLNYKVAKTWSDDINAKMSNTLISFSFGNRKADRSKIIIGYVSGDFRNHPVARLMQGIYRCHDRNKFEIYCYSFGRDDNSRTRQNIVENSDRFVEIGHMNYQEAAEQIYKDQVDILVDLMGHTRNNRMEIFSLRPAPVQVTYLGFLGTTGADFIDYILTDKVVTPEPDAKYYSEKFIYLPGSFLVSDVSEQCDEFGFNRSDFDLPENKVVFCSFNEPYKIDQTIFNTWMNILRQVPGSVLWLLGKNNTVERNLKNQAMFSGILANRLKFAKKIPLKEHLKRLELADIALDTKIYNGGATTIYALQAGVPVITIYGKHFASRVSSSCLTQLNMPELIAGTLEEYEQSAVALANDRKRIQAYRNHLVKQRNTADFFNTISFVNHLEAAYRQIWQRFCAGHKPQAIQIPPATSPETKNYI